MVGPVSGGLLTTGRFARRAVSWLGALCGVCRRKGPLGAAGRLCRRKKKKTVQCERSGRNNVDCEARVYFVRSLTKRRKGGGGGGGGLGGGGGRERERCGLAEETLKVKYCASLR